MVFMVIMQIITYVWRGSTPSNPNHEIFPNDYTPRSGRYYFCVKSSNNFCGETVAGISLTYDPNQPTLYYNFS